jgi:hypothetical protein
MEQPEQVLNNDKTDMVFMTLTKVEGQIFTNQTGHSLSPPSVATTTPSFLKLSMQTTSSPIQSSRNIEPNSSRLLLTSIITCESMHICPNFTNKMMKLQMMLRST